MAGTITAGTLSDGTNSTSTTNCIQGSAKAWVNFNGGNTNTAGAINGSYNVSSVTVNSTGNFNVNMTNAMPNTNYVPVATQVRGTSLFNDYGVPPDALAVSTTVVNVGTKASAGAAVAVFKVYVAVFD